MHSPQQCPLCIYISGVSSNDCICMMMVCYFIIIFYKYDICAIAVGYNFLTIHRKCLESPLKQISKKLRIAKLKCARNWEPWRCTNCDCTIISYTDYIIHRFDKWYTGWLRYMDTHCEWLYFYIYPPAQQLVLQGTHFHISYLTIQMMESVTGRDWKEEEKK